MYRNLRVVPRLIYGRGSIRQLGEVLSRQRPDTGAPVTFLIDGIHEERPWVKQLPLHANDLVVVVTVRSEPSA